MYWGKTQTRAMIEEKTHFDDLVDVAASQLLGSHIMNKGEGG
jgi:hypothetical protein